jgi:hypothetical protein
MAKFKLKKRGRRGTYQDQAAGQKKMTTKEEGEASRQST